jgi:hypothetical protein
LRSTELGISNACFCSLSPGDSPELPELIPAAEGDSEIIEEVVRKMGEMRKID